MSGPAAAEIMVPAVAAQTFSGQTPSRSSRGETVARHRADPFRRLPAAAFAILAEPDPLRLVERAADELQREARADAIRLAELDDDRLIVRVERGFDWRITDAALELDARLSEDAMAAGRSLLSTHRHLARELRPAADAAHASGVSVLALLLRAHGETHAVASLFWVGTAPPHDEALRPLLYLCDFVGLAVAGARWRARALEHQTRLERLAFVDDLTGLPNARALEEELSRHAGGTSPLSILHVDFDGLREANNNLGYEAGGDALIRAVGGSLPGLLRPEEFAARAHSAGDEFVCVLPDVGEAQIADRALELERGLAQIALPPSLHAYFRGASVGGVTALGGETAQDLLVRAAKMMRIRKEQRAAARMPGGAAAHEMAAALVD